MKERKYYIFFSGKNKDLNKKELQLSLMFGMKVPTLEKNDFFLDSSKPKVLDCK